MPPPMPWSRFGLVSPRKTNTWAYFHTVTALRFMTELIQSLVYAGVLADPVSALEWTERGRARSFLVRLRLGHLESGASDDLRRRETSLLADLTTLAAAVPRWPMPMISIG